MAKAENPKLDVGHFSAFPLLTEVAEHPAFPKMGRGKHEHDRWYAKAIEKLVKGVPEKSGWYMWGNFNEAAWWQPLYIGKASRSEKWGGLKARIHHEFRVESPAVFATVYGRDAATTTIRKLLNQWHKESGKDFVGQGENIQRSLRKTGTHFVVWAGVPGETSEGEIKEVEAALIQRYRAGFNVMRPVRGEFKI